MLSYVEYIKYHHNLYFLSGDSDKLCHIVRMSDTEILWHSLDILMSRSYTRIYLALYIPDKLSHILYYIYIYIYRDQAHTFTNVSLIL